MYVCSVVLVYLSLPFCHIFTVSIPVSISLSLPSFLYLTLPVFISIHLLTYPSMPYLLNFQFSSVYSFPPSLPTFPCLLCPTLLFLSLPCCLCLHLHFRLLTCLSFFSCLCFHLSVRVFLCIGYVMFSCLYSKVSCLCLFSFWLFVLFFDFLFCITFLWRFLSHLFQLVLNLPSPFSFSYLRPCSAFLTFLWSFLDCVSYLPWGSLWLYFYFPITVYCYSCAFFLLTFLWSFFYFLSSLPWRFLAHLFSFPLFSYLSLTSHQRLCSAFLLFFALFPKLHPSFYLPISPISGSRSLCLAVLLPLLGLYTSFYHFLNFDFPTSMILLAFSYLSLSHSFPFSFPHFWEGIVLYICLTTFFLLLFL